MSSCRCDEMKACEQKINRLKSAASSMNSLESRITSIGVRLSSISAYTNILYVGDNKENLKGAIIGLDNSLRNVPGMFCGKVDARVQELEKDLDEMTAEDEEYHAEEEEDEDDTTDQNASQTNS